jgi:hypothetical protein
LIPLLPTPIGRVLTWLERQILGIDTIEPREVAWEHVSHIDVVVHLDLKREETGLIHTQETIWQRFIRPLPGGNR